MATTSGIYDYVRLDIGDPDGAIFNDAMMNRLILKAVTRLNNKLALSKTVRPIGVGGQFGGKRISIPPITVDIGSQSISPDNDEITDMIVLQMEVIILKSEIASLRRLNPALGGAFGLASSSAVQDDVSVTNADGVSVTVGNSRFSTRARLYQLSLESLEQELKDAVTRFLSRMSSSFGKYIY